MQHEAGSAGAPAAKSSKVKPAVIALALLPLALAALLPPESYPEGKLAVIVSSSFVFLLSLVEHRISRKYLWAGVALFGVLLIHDFVFSVDLYRSLEFTSVLWGYYCLFGFFLYAGFEPVVPVAVSLVALSAIVSGYGLYQYFWGFERLQDYVASSGADDVVKAPALDIIQARRVSSTLPLPGTLWGFLLLCLPFYGLLWGRSRRIDFALVCGAVLLLATGFLTRSFGFLVGLFVLTTAWLVLKRGSAGLKKVALAVVVLALLGGFFYSTRRSVIQSSNPLALRAMNWASAWSVFAGHPMGTGLNTFGVVYPKYMLPAANDTQNAHNTPVQLLSELGLTFAAIAAALLFVIVRRQRHASLNGPPLFLLLSLIVWSIHNLIDIDVYFPSVGIIGVVVAGVYFRRQDHLRRTSFSVAPYGCAVLAALAFMAFAALATVSTELQYRAQAEFEEKKWTEAAKTLKLATAIMPWNSSLFHDAGDVLLNLYHTRHDSSALESATSSFRHAVRLSPMKAVNHTGLTLSLASAGRVEEALAEIRVAQELAPRSTNIAAIRKMLETRRDEANQKQAAK